MLGREYFAISGKHCEISLEKRPPYCDRGNWIAKLHIVMTAPTMLYIDHADGWPRYYFDLDRAQAELIAWLQKRNEYIPGTAFRKEIA